MTVLSSVKIRMICVGKSNEVMAITKAAMPATKTERPSTFWMLVRLPAPQNWERKIDAPEQTPKYSRLMRKNIWFAKATAAIEASPSCPIITVSTKESELFNKPWKTTGRAMPTIFL